MITTLNPQYGHYLVRKMNVVEDIIFGLCSVTKRLMYGVFKINHARYSYDCPEEVNPCNAYKVDLEPVGFTCFQRRDWYACDVLKFGDSRPAYQVFDDYAEALNWATSMNNIKDVK